MIDKLSKRKVIKYNIKDIFFKKKLDKELFDQNF